MGLVALQAGPINRAFTQCVSNVSQIKAKITNSMFTLITLFCNTTFASVNILWFVCAQIDTSVLFWAERDSHMFIGEGTNV